MIEKVEDNRDVDMNVTNAQDHVPEAERNNRTIKEMIRAAYHRLPYKAIPQIMICYLAMIQANQLNLFPVKGGFSKYYKQPPHDIEPDQSGLHQTLCFAIWNLCAGKPQVNEVELECYKNNGRDLPASPTKPTRRS
jgi:hypothetical protein